MSILKYPLNIRFKFWAMASQFSITNADGSIVAYVKQKIFKLKEDVQVFSDESMSHQIFSIKADRIIDFSARYHIKDAKNEPMGEVKRDGVKSLWRIHYSITTIDGQTFIVQEDNPWIRIFDALLSEIPIIGLLSARFFQPIYNVKSPDGNIVMKMKKMPSFLERFFSIDRLIDINDRDEELIMLSLMMIVLLEKNEG
jgi:uncharacterized protein YxjI